MARASYHHGNLRATLVQAGIGLIAEKGVDGFNLRELARRAGVSPGAPYRHFSDKDALLAAVATEGFLQLNAVLTDAAADEPNPTLGFRAQGLAFTRFAIANPAHFRTMYLARLHADSDNTELATARANANQIFRDQIAKARKSGGLAPFDEQHIALAALAVTYGTARLFVDGVLPRGEDESLAQHVTEAVTEVFGFGLVPRIGPLAAVGQQTPSLPIELLPDHGQ